MEKSKEKDEEKQENGEGKEGKKDKEEREGEKNEEVIVTRGRGRTMIGVSVAPSRAPAEKVKDVPFSKSKRFAFGASETVGKRPTMEDVSLCVGNFRGREEEDLFGVFDGHGSIEAASFVAKHFASVLEEELGKDEEHVQDCLSKAFFSLNSKMEWAETSGCTAAICFVKGNTIYSANVGDARVVVCQENKAVRLSFDHKPTLREEEERILALGGKVEGGRVEGILAVSRAFGDYKLRPFVSVSPFLASFPIDSLSSHLILACDGVWDVLPDQMAASLVKNQPDPLKASKALRDRALASGSTDNISVIVVQLSPLLSQQQQQQQQHEKQQDEDEDSEEKKKQLETKKQENLKKLEDGELWL